MSNNMKRAPSNKQYLFLLTVFTVGLLVASLSLCTAAPAHAQEFTCKGVTGQALEVPPGYPPVTKQTMDDWLAVEKDIRKAARACLNESTIKGSTFLLGRKAACVLARLGQQGETAEIARNNCKWDQACRLGDMASDIAKKCGPEALPASVRALSGQPT